MLVSIQTFSDRLNRRVETALAAMGMSMTMVVILQVIFRYMVNQSLFWSEELARFLLIWLSFLGASVAYRRGVHPGVDICFARLSFQWQQWVMVGVHLVSICLFGVMVVKGAAFVWFVRLQISPALSLPKWAIMSIIPLAGGIMMVHGVRFLLETLLKPEDFPMDTDPGAAP